MHVEDSNSVNVSRLTVTGIKQVSKDVLQIATSSGTFFLRLCYLSQINAENIDVNVCFDEDEQTEIVDAALAFACEQKAISYLSRTEHSRFMLETKLYNKQHTKESIQKALDYLENRTFLDDRRFAQAWLRNRSITKAEGPSRLSIELAKRGVSRDIVNDVLSEYFEDNDVELLFKKALDKLQRLGKTGDKLRDALIRQGFDWKMIKMYYKEND